jgi:leader peptidase (prepilin peptidase)/N-methyltransferase
MNELLRPFYVPLAALFGLLVGSFLNVVIYRLPREESIVFPGSHCASCNASLRWYHNIPLFSFLFLKGQCHACKNKISYRYPIVEALTAALFALAVAREPQMIAWPFQFYFLAALLVSTAIDLEHWIIPDMVTLPGIMIGLIGSFLIPDHSLMDSLLGVLVGGGILFSIAWIYTTVTKKEGIGGGDIKFLAMVGAFLGAKGALETLILSSFVGSLLGVFLIIAKGKGGKTAIPFGPFLSGGAFCAFLFGETLWKWYFQV